MINSNDPLTVDELREMDGEPVWVFPVEPLKPCWAIVHGEMVTGYLPGCKYPENYSLNEIGAYGIGWLAYRRKPEEAEV